ncbi:kinase-like domain-containing protein [Staphylotrichum tortipilum]|uniref:Kinase-like domain-containing protein n=1 Tax=Staphylotrichum tortipilum TaxID=2831512 RepID=A0AAN6MQF9_9PEZI|nr:kinase-like domain-containing protein [Staphylotrichum longicolle]
MLSSASSAINFLRRTYGENGWHVKPVFHGTIEADEHPVFGRRPKRRSDLQDLCRCIDFRRIHLLDDPVTEVAINLSPAPAAPDAASEYASVAGQLCVSTREDPLRIRFPAYHSGDDSSVPMRALSELQDKDELNGHSVYTARLRGDDTPYIYKQVDRPHYMPPDTEVLEQELRNLTLFRGTALGIVQLFAAVVSRNPYHRAVGGPAVPSTVLRGLLLEFHPNGTLESWLALPERRTKAGGHWCRWARQTASALAAMHQRGLAHMDLKPANVVINAGLDAVLNDVSGIGGVAQQWLAPEMLAAADPLSQSIEARKKTISGHWLREATQIAVRPPPRAAVSDIVAVLSEYPCSAP